MTVCYLKHIGNSEHKLYTQHLYTTGYHVRKMMA